MRGQVERPYFIIIRESESACLVLLPHLFPMESSPLALSLLLSRSLAYGTSAYGTLPYGTLASALSLSRLWYIHASSSALICTKHLMLSGAAHARPTQPSRMPQCPHAHNHTLMPSRLHPHARMPASSCAHILHLTCLLHPSPLPQTQPPTPNPQPPTPTPLGRGCDFGFRV